MDLLSRKLWGTVILAAAGLPIGRLIDVLAYRGVYGPYHVVAGGLAGAVLGGILPGRRLGRFGWGIVLGVGSGTLIGGLVSHHKDMYAFEGAVAGYLFGLAAGLISEYVARSPVRG